MTKVILGSDIRGAIARQLQSAYPREGCGVLVGFVEKNSVRIVEAVPIDNVETSSGNDRYRLDPLQYAALEAKLKQRSDGARIVGFFHSHPDGLPRPSKVDLEMAQGLFEFARATYIYAIQPIAKDGSGELTFWKLAEKRDSFVRLTSD